MKSVILAGPSKNRFCCAIIEGARALIVRGDLSCLRGPPYEIDILEKKVILSFSHRKMQ